MNTAGFKLERFEVYNWGTFDETVWIIEPKSCGALLTGENGSGKSTLVDGLLTLLVPNVKRNYNLASGNEKKERSELTYVRGAYAREQNELGSGQTKFLRKEENYSVLLAKFHNDLTQESITLGQFFWFEHATLHKLFFVSHANISIKEHFSQIKNSKEVRSRLKNIGTTQVFTTFSEYQAYFIRYVGLRSEKGLDLFNQITAIKEISRLNEFVRKHMLNANDTQELLNSLYANYQNLELAYQAILLSKHQLAELDPLAEDAKKFKITAEKLIQIQQERQTLPYTFAWHKKTALTNQQAEFSQKLIASETMLSTFERKLNSLSDQKMELSRLLAQDEIGQECTRLKMLIEQHQEKMRATRKEAEHYAQWAQRLNFPATPTLKEFAKSLEHCKTIISGHQAQLVELQHQQYEAKKAEEHIHKTIEVLVAEVKSLKGRKNRLPTALIKVRDDLAKTLGFSVNDVPFIAELMKVQEVEWEGAIERLLHSFALRMLVPQDLYLDVCKILNRRDIGVRLVFQKVDEQFNVKPQTLKQIDANKLIHKLAFRNQSSYTPWLKEQIIKHYDYACVSELAAFQKQFKAITPQGLIKHGFSLNEKDDRFSIEDKSRYILGWDNQEKLNWLLQEIQQHQTALDAAAKAMQSINKTISQVEVELSAANALSNIQDYDLINWQASAEEIASLQKRLAMLSNKHQKSGQIQKDLQQLEHEKNHQQQSRDNTLKEIAVLSSAIQELAREIEYCENTLNQYTNQPVETPWLNAYMKKRKIKFASFNLRDYAIMEKNALDTINVEIYKAEADKQQLQVMLVRKMTQFKTRFSEQAIDLDATLDSLSGYLDLQQKLKTESLPEYERRFRKLLSKSVMNDMAVFKSTLDLAYEEIESTVHELNDVLATMNYSQNTYVQLQIVRNKDVEVREFHHLLKYALLDANADNNQDTESDVSFERIKTLLDRLKNEERWCKKVTDVRNWADFSVLEKIRTTNEPKNYYSDSAGLSGGQKAKLAFTILGAAIAHQYGLDLESDKQTGKKSSGNSFRFIVVDEAFSKSDEKNSRYAMELFQKLQLQVMVVTPKDKIHLVEPYVKSIFLTYINEGQDRSQLINLSLEHHAKQSSLINTVELQTA
ncbi:MAG: hypothetical protein KIT27_01600 [Legionellales bacterium]|nr:hypothetical protein [Legionellales bacterium]